MALTSADVQAAVDACNEAIHSIDSGIGELDVIDEIKGYADELHKVWETENGEKSMIELYKVIDSLQTNTDNLKKAMENIKNDTYTFTTTHETEYTN